MLKKIDALRQIIQSQITETELQADALTLLDEIEDHTQKTASSYEILQSLQYDLHTPIGSILGFTKLLLDEDISGELNQNQYEDLELIHKSGQILLRRINGLLDFARVKTSSIQIQPKLIKIHGFLEKRRPNFQKIAREKNCSLNLSFKELDVKILADPWQLYNILREVLMIACAYEEIYTVEMIPQIITIHKSSWLEINISTQGYGIPMAIWYELYQGGLVYQQFGTWEGLALPYELCQLMDGSLEVFRESDSSIRYSVRFPLVEENITV